MVRLKGKVLGTFALAMMAVVAIIDLRGLPLMASYGLSSVFFYSLAALFFLIPTGLIVSELTTKFPEAGGLYTWVKHAFGNRVGFFVIWLEWLNNVISFPASLSFIAVYLIYPFTSHVAQHNTTIFIIILAVLWGNTFFTLLGIKASSWLDDAGALFGTIIPAIIITGLAVIWLAKGNSPHITFHSINLLPNFHSVSWAFFAATLLGYSGIQVIAFHVTNVKNPQRDYPRSILIATVIIVAVTVAATLAIAVIVPTHSLKIISGLVDGFALFFNAFHMGWATPILVALIVLSVIATFNIWFLGPARGLAVAAQNGFFPRMFGRMNKNEIPYRLLILQAVIVSILSLIFLFLPDISSGFWVLLILSSQSTILMWIFIFAAAVKLRYSKSSSVQSRERVYIIPGGNWGIWVVAAAGCLVCITALSVSFILPQHVKMGLGAYEALLIISNLIFLSIPFIIYSLMKRSSRRLSS